MKTTSIKNQNVKKVCIIAHNWLLIAIIGGLIGITGCVPPMNTATGQRAGKKEVQLANTSYSKSKKYKNSSKNKQDADDNTVSVANNISESEEYNEIIEFEKRINNNSKNNTRSNTNNSRIDTVVKSKSTPSLKEQMEELYQKQDVMEENIYSIKEDLLEVKGMISSIAADKFKPSAARPVNNSIKAEDDFPKNHTIIDSDEDVMMDDNFMNSTVDEEKNKASKQEKPATAPMKTEEKPKPQQNKDFKIVKASSQKTSTVESKPKENPKEEVKTKPNTTASQSAETTEVASKSTDNDFSNIITTIAKKDYNSAIKQIGEKMKSTKNSEVIANCNYWLGECFFNQRDYAKSIDYFKQVLDQQCDKKDVAQARIAESYLRVGKNDEAKIAYQTLLREYPKSTHSPKAKKILQQL